MSLWSRIWAALRNLTHKHRTEADLDAEVRACAEMLADEKMADGMPAAEARRKGLAELGGMEQVKQAVRDKRAGTGVERVWQDMRFGLRQLRRSPGFTITGLLIIAIGLVPHRRWQEGDYEGWDHPNPSQIGTNQHRVFAKDSWGGEWHPDFVPQKGDVVAGEHWAQSGFANTDLDAQLKQRGITHVIVVGLLANTCIESTARFAMEMGYHVTLVRDATAAFSHEHMHAAHDLNGPTFAHAITTTSELVATLAHPGAAVAI